MSYPSFKQPVQPYHPFAKQREQYNFLIESTGQIVFCLDKDGICTFANTSWEVTTGFTLADLITHPLAGFISKEYITAFSKNIQLLLGGDISVADMRLKLLTAKGDRVLVRMRLKMACGGKGEADEIFGIIEHINEGHNAEVLLQEANDKLKSILNNSKEIIITIDIENNRIADVNEAISVLGYKPSDWINTSINDWTEKQREKFRELMKLALQSELQVKNQLISFSNKSGTEVVPFEFSTSIFYHKNTKYLLCVLRDASERLKYEYNITRISDQLTHLINNIDDVYAIYDIKTDSYDFISDNVEQLYDCDKQLFYRDIEFWKSRIAKEDLAGVLKEVEEIIQNKTRGQIFYRINTCTGDQRMILEKLVVSQDSEGNADKLYIVKTDYTTIENAEQSLLETQRKFRFISENLSDFISIHDTDWNFTYASPSVTNIIGFEPTDIIGMGGFDLVHPEDMVSILNNSLQPVVIEKKETRFRYRMLSKDGSYKWVETYAKPVIDNKGEMSSIICSTRDVTEQVHAQHKLMESEEQYRFISENSNDIVSIHNLKKEFTYVSPSCKQILGYDASELIGKQPKDVFLKAQKKEISDADEVISRKKESKFILEVITKSGEEKLLEVWQKPIFKGDEIVALQSASRDVTERERLLKELELSLEKERELNELKSKFVSMASHQFRTPLTVIQSGVEIMELYIDDLPADKQEKFQKQFVRMQEEINRLSYLMNDVLLLGRANATRTPFEPTSDSLVAFCQSIVTNKYNNIYTADRQVIISVKGTEVPVSFDPKLLGHVVENLLSNAYKYSGHDNLLLDLVYMHDKVVINITDKGIGIPEEDLKNLFQPFYRATNTTEIAGTGLGLSIVKEFIEKHGGKIFLDSELNKGTTVSVILPIQ